MKTDFKDWLQLRESGSMSTTGIYTPQSGLQSPMGSSQMSYQTQTPPSMPVQQSNIPWQMNYFKNWYNSNRGNWSDVAKAAQTDPNVKAFLSRIANSLVRDGMHYPKDNSSKLMDDEFDTTAATKMGDFGDELEKMIRSQISDHGKNQSQPTLQPMKQPTLPRINQHSSAGAMSQLAHMNSQPDADTSQLVDTVRSLMLRMDDIERRLHAVTKVA